jgi:RNA polymerase sigma-70 factor (ECF subfamily)
MSMPDTIDVAEGRFTVKAVVLPHLDDLYRVALRLTHSSDEAEELVAVAAARACENIASLRDLDKAKQWLLRILTNAFFSSRRTKKRRQETPYVETEEQDESPFSLFEALEQYHHDETNPERMVINKLMDDEIQSAIAELPQEYRAAIVLCDVEGYAYNEIAAILDVPVGTVRSRLARGRGLLQKRLYHYAEEQGWLPPKNASSRGNTDNEPCKCKRD